MSAKSANSSQVISFPKGGGALHGIGEKFSPDLHTGTGNFKVPIALPAGRNGLQPQLNLVYSTGQGNGPFGLGWSLSIPGIARQTSHGVPRYIDYHVDPKQRDTFILSGAEDLVPVDVHDLQAIRYAPRTEGLFARIDHIVDPATQDNHWEVQSKDGLISIYGTPASVGNDPAVIAKPGDLSHIFAWKLTETRDPFGNRIEYLYDSDEGEVGPHRWKQPLLHQIRYADYTDPDPPYQKKFLVSVSFEYEDRLTDPFALQPITDSFSEYRSGFEIRTTKRCKRIVVRTNADADRLVRTYELIYLDQRGDIPNLKDLLPINRVSVLSQIKVTGHDEANNQKEELPPLEFGYTRFTPEKRDFFPITGADMPPASLANPDYEMADLIGNGLPDVLEMNGTVRYWRNLGKGRFDLPREMKTAPAGVALAQKGVQLIDANGDGRLDLLVTTAPLAGFYPMSFGGFWDHKSFQKYQSAPSFDLEDPEVKLVDLDGDGVTDAIRSGTRFECFFNDPHDGWTPERTRWVEREPDLDVFPDINFSDPRVKWADMTGDGLQDIVLVYDGNVEYWPNLGRGDWGRRISMRNSPRLPYGYDPKRILFGDVDGDGLADIVYVDDAKVTLWINQSGNSWSDPVVIHGTPPVSDMDAVRLTDMLGSGISGVLWSSDAGALSRESMFFLDFTGGTKPYLLNEMNNHMGAVTRVEYAPSTQFYLADQQQLATRWKTPLPFPVLVVARVEVIDELSKGKLTTEYRYHHGYWDGAEREFRGFGMVEQRDTETFEAYNQPGLHGEETAFAKVEDKRRFSPPTLTKTWFHQGPVGEEFGEWYELDYTAEFWTGDLPMFPARPKPIEIFLKGLPRRAKRDALRALRGSILRTELYALDGTDRQDRPYTVAESLFGVCEVLNENGEPKLTWELRPDDLANANGARLSSTAVPRIFFAHRLAQRTTQWERGDDPMTQFSFTEDYDDYGQPRKQTRIACPRGWRDLTSVPAQPYLATRSRTTFATPQNPDVFIMDRMAKTTTCEIINNGGQTLFTLKDLPDSNPSLKVIGQTLNFYDGSAFQGLALGKVAKYGALTRTESLVLTDELLDKAYDAGNNSGTPSYFVPEHPPNLSAEYPPAFRAALPINQSSDPSRPEFDLNPLGYGLPKPAFAADCESGFFVATERRRYDFQDAAISEPRGLVLAKRDPLGANAGQRDTHIVYDDYALLPFKVTDPVGLETTAHYDYRVLQPDVVTDPNHNRTAFTYTPLGLLETTAVMGKEGENSGDTETVPGWRLVYGFLGFMNSPPEQRQPVFVRTIRRVHHFNEMSVADQERDETIETVEYSDGFGRLLQTRTQAEEVIFGDPVFGGDVLPAQQGDPHTKDDIVGIQNTDASASNVVVSGWQIYDNKGRVVEKYEPFFSTGWQYRSPDEERTSFNREVLGEKATMFYDPRGHVIRTVNPDSSEQRALYGIPGTIAAPNLDNPDKFEPTPWEAFTYDANDNAGRTHSGDSAGYRHHWNTPSSVLIDASGRTVKTVERNRPTPEQASDPLLPIEEYTTRSTYDIRGNLLTVTDQLSRVAFQHVYDLANRPLRVENIDAGIRRTVLDAAGNVVEQRDSKGALILRACDVLNRPTKLWARDNADSGATTLRERLEYGDGGDSQQPSAERDANRSQNRLDKLGRHHDEAGLLAFEAYDFKGNVLEKVRQVISDSTILNALPNGFPVNWDQLVGLLDPQQYRTSVVYDALNRVKKMTYPQDVEDGRKELVPAYNRAGALESVNLGGKTYAERIAYNAKGKRTLIAYGNGVMTRYAYDSQTFRLKRLLSERYQNTGGLIYEPAGTVLQDFAYKYDLAGNIRTITDQTPHCGVTNSAGGRNLLKREFGYDPLYHLTSATGRECKTIPVPRPWGDWRDEQNCGFNSGTPDQNNAPDLTAEYWEDYRYDPAGNMLRLAHRTKTASWTRNFGMGGMTPEEWNQQWPAHVNTEDIWVNPPGNQLTHVGDNDEDFPATHFYDANGNLIRENTTRYFERDHCDQVRAFRNQNGASTSSIHACYLYDASGQRVKKLVRDQQGDYEVTIYVDGVFEHHRIGKSNGTLQNNTLHVMDNQSRIALVRVGDALPSDGAPEVKVKFHMSDHLGNSNTVTSHTASWINREEFTPFGDTSFGSFARKRYRFAGKENDAESGLYYNGARYYVPWAARWASCDPAGMVDGTSLYARTRNNPLNATDPTGTQEKPRPNEGGEGGGAEGYVSETAEPENPTSNNSTESHEGKIKPSSFTAKPLSEMIRDYAEERGPKCFPVPQRSGRGVSSEPPQLRMPAPAKSPDAKQKMYETMAKDPIAALFIGLGIFVEATAGKIFKFELDPRRAAAGGEFASGVVVAAGSLNTPPPQVEPTRAPDTITSPLTRSNRRGTTAITELRANGNAFRDEIADALRKHFEGTGYTVLTEVSKKTALGMRFMDIEILDATGQPIGGIETKLNNSPYKPQQRAIDQWLWIQEGYRVVVVREPAKTP